jgi:nucleoside-diphosphate-sugar epimerase
VARAYTVGTVVVEGDGNSWSPLVHVEDVCQAVIAVLTAPRLLIHGEAFNVGGTRENYRVRDIADLAVGAVPGAVIRSTRASSPVPPGFRLNCDKIADVLDFRPAWDLRRGASELVSTFRRGRLTLEDYTSDRYRRLQHLSDLLAAGRIGSDLRSRPPVHSTLPFS